MDNTMTILKESLKTKGYKLTPQRKAILDVIIEHKGEHLTSEEIYDIVKATKPEIGLATVYRTLILFEDLDVVYRHNFGDGCGRYELNLNGEEHQHHHLICNSCGKVIEVEIDLLDDLESKIEAEYDFDIKDHKLKFFGICSNCKKA